jgi:hypothetical protein
LILVFFFKFGFDQCVIICLQLNMKMKIKF